MLARVSFIKRFIEVPTQATKQIDSMHIRKQEYKVVNFAIYYNEVDKILNLPILIMLTMNKFRYPNIMRFHQQDFV